MLTAFTRSTQPPLAFPILGPFLTLAGRHRAPLPSPAALPDLPVPAPPQPRRCQLLKPLVLFTNALPWNRGDAPPLSPCRSTLPAGFMYRIDFSTLIYLHLPSFWFFFTSLSAPFETAAYQHHCRRHAGNPQPGRAAQPLLAKHFPGL